MLAFARRKVGDRTGAEDIVQEAFVGFLNSLPHFDEQRELQTYLFTITAYKIADWLRKQGRRLVLATEGDDALGHQTDPDQLAASSLARDLEKRDLERRALGQALGRLVAGWRAKGDFPRVQALELLLVKGWPNRDVARFLGVSEQQVANYRFAAVKKLTEHVRSMGLSPDVFPELATG